MSANSKLLRCALVAVSLCVLAGNSVLLYSSLGSLIDAAEWLRHSLSIKQVLSETVAELARAQSAKRGYVLTDDVFDLESYYISRRESMIRIDKLRDLVSDNDRQSQIVDRISKITKTVFERMDEIIRLSSADEGDRVQNMIRLNRDSEVMREFNISVDEIEHVEEQLLKKRQENVDTARRSAFIALSGFITTVALMTFILYYFAVREIKQKTQASQDIKLVADQLHRQTEDLTRERNEIAQLNEASSFLQSCNTIAEIAAAFPPFMQTMFPVYHGAVYLTAASRNRLDPLASWGGAEEIPHLSPQQCWGLRRGQVHLHEPGAAAPICDHFGGMESGAMSLCVPLVAHGETIGLLALWSTAGESGQSRTRRLADMVARQLGLTLANIRLRESLKEQTIRDAMTNAFNRRYLEVVSQKEIAKARRFSRPMVVAMIDIDHFKRFNDTHGHPAGDAALVRVSQYLQENIRESDWLFRYGGEEFLMILTDTGAQEAHVRLDTLKAGIAQMVIRHEGTTLPHVTISCGLAAFPTDGQDFDGIVSLADEALYRAKQGGRNCVRMALGDAAASASVEPQPV